MGKLFTFFILFMSIAFLSVAIMVGASHKEWKKVAQENKEAADRYSRLLNEAKKTSNDIQKELEREKVSRQQQIAQLQSQLVQALENQRETNDLYQGEQVRATQYRERLTEAEARLTKQDAEIDKLLRENVQYADDYSQQSVTVVNLQNRLNETSSTLQDQRLMNEDMRDTIANTTRVMNAYGLADDELTRHIAPELDGAVLRAENNVIVISLGTDDGLRQGHIIDIYRGSRFVGKATVTRESQNMSAAVLQPEYTQLAVQEGDHVTTKF
ncbi:MAG: hypothetical protein AAF456_07975 [Planctomycetota bacterium]